MHHHFLEGRYGPFDAIVRQQLQFLRPGVEALGGLIPDGLTICAIPAGRFTASTEPFDDGSTLIEVNHGAYELLFLALKSILPVFRFDDPEKVGFDFNLERARQRMGFNALGATLQEVVAAYGNGEAPYQVEPFYVPPNGRLIGKFLNAAECFVIAHESAHLLLRHHGQITVETRPEKRYDLEMEADISSLQMLLMSIHKSDPSLGELAYVAVDLSLTILELAHAVTHKNPPTWAPTPAERKRRLRRFMIVGYPTSGKHFVKCAASFQAIAGEMMKVDTSQVTNYELGALRWWRD